MEEAHLSDRYADRREEEESDRKQPIRDQGAGLLLTDYRTVCVCVCV